MSKTKNSLSDNSPIKNNSNTSLSNLKYLARELSHNYFLNSAIDLIKSEYSERENPAKYYYDLNDWVFNHENIDEVKCDPDYASNSKSKQTPFTHNDYTRNVLVIGAGATHNAFPEVPLAADAMTLIYESTVLGDLSKNHDRNLNTVLFNKIEKDFPQFKEILKNLEPKMDKSFARPKQVKVSEEVMMKYLEEYEKLNLYTSEYGKYRELDFETSLNLLSKILPTETVRSFIQEIYDFKFGPCLHYEIIAHLFKHGFIDVIINFNFDELLDQAIADEMGIDSYDKILSDGDCPKSLEDKLSNNGKLRQPLYIKPHGTTSHKSTLRFTKDHYFEIPVDTKNFISKIFKCEDGQKFSIQKRINLITLGFEMESVQFNNILRSSLPANSQIFSFYHFDNQKENLTEGKMYQSRKDKLLNIFENARHKPSLRLIGHEYFNSNEDAQNLLKENGLEPLKGATSLGNCFELIYHFIQSYFKREFRPRNISNHKVIDSVFGNEKFLKIVKDINKNGILDYFKSKKYFADRLLIEILIELTASNGKIDFYTLMNSRAGRYYSYYHHDSNEKDKTLEDFINYFQKDIKSAVKLKPMGINEVGYFGYETFDAFTTAIFDKSQEEESYFSTEMKHYFKRMSEPVKASIFRRFNMNRESSKSSVNTNIRSLDHYIFKNFNIKDLITTDLSLDLHFYDILENTKTKKICIVADYGVQMTKFLKKIINRKIQVYIILCDYREEKNLQDGKSKFEGHEINVKKSKKAILDLITDISPEDFDDHIKIRYLPINRHNHHMALFLGQNNHPIKAIYYRQQGLSKKINPIQLFELNNTLYLMQQFERYSVRAFKNYDLKDDNWIDFSDSLKQS